MAQELISHKVLSLDFWQDIVTCAGSVMPTGTIGCAVLNIPDKTITQYLGRGTLDEQTAAVYLYRVDNNGEWGEIRFDFENGTMEIVKLADWDTIKSNVFAKTAIRYVQSLLEVRMLRFVVVPFESETLEK